MKFKVNMTGSGEPGDPWRVDLPTYVMVPGTEDYKKKVCVVEVPAGFCDKGKLSEAKIRKLYEGQEKWDREGVLKGVLATAPA